MSAKSLNVVGIGEDGLDGLPPVLRRLVEKADMLVGGKRHLAKVPEGGHRRIDWSGGFEAAFDEIEKQLEKPGGQTVVVLASGDPLNFGVGANVVRRFGADAVNIFPAPGAFSLAAARMGWPLADIKCLTVHGRAIEAVHLHLVPAQRLLILSWDGETPGKLAELLNRRGFGPSEMTVLANMSNGGGGGEIRTDGIAETWDEGPAGNEMGDLNTVAVECVAAKDADPAAWTRVPGLPEEVFEHDGLITKREVRAQTLARLMPMPGQTLWDVGAGSGAIGIEWLRAEPASKAFAIERDPARAAVIARNAENLGVPELKIIEGEAPGILSDIETKPGAVFLGGGASVPGLLEACWQALNPGGRLVANAVTIEAEQSLLAFQNEFGGDLTRLSISRAHPIGGPVGRLTAFRPFKQVTQLAMVKK